MDLLARLLIEHTSLCKFSVRASRFLHKKATQKKREIIQCRQSAGFRLTSPRGVNVVCQPQVAQLWNKCKLIDDIETERRMLWSGALVKLATPPTGLSHRHEWVDWKRTSSSPVLAEKKTKKGQVYSHFFFFFFMFLYNKSNAGRAGKSNSLGFGTQTDPIFIFVFPSACVSQFSEKFFFRK